MVKQFRPVEGLPIRITNMLTAAGHRATCRVTGHFRSLPDFLVIGAQKAGTTSLFRYLHQHPDVADIARKEIHYFDLNFHRGRQWYCSFFPLEVTRRLHSKRTGRPLMAGEATPSYLFHPLVPSRVRELIPRPRMIVLLRNPVERAFSHYNHLRSRRRESRAFEKVIQSELDTRRRGIKWEECRKLSDVARLGILERGLYVKQLELWFSFFPRDSFLIFKSEDLFSNPRKALSITCNFLELQVTHDIELSNFNKGEYVDQMDERVKAMLNEFYSGANRRLTELVGIEF